MEINPMHLERGPGARGRASQLGCGVRPAAGCTGELEEAVRRRAGGTAVKHGQFTCEAIELRREMWAFLRACRETLERLCPTRRLSPGCVHSNGSS